MKTNLLSKITNAPLKLDLAIGHPSFMQDYWRTQSPFFVPPVENFSMRSFHYLPEMDPLLEQAIREIHNTVGNAETTNAHLALAMGATQTLTACLHTLKGRGFTMVTAEAPHFTRFKNCTELAGLAWKAHPTPAESQSGELIEIVTAPNNPDGKMQVGQHPNSLKIYDLCYHWPQYTEVFKRDHDMMIFSLSKSTGHAGSRVGWLLTKDKELAQSVSSYVFGNHYGVSYDAQRAATQVLHACKQNSHFTCFDYAKDVLAKRYESIQAAFKNHPKYELKSKPGLFALLKLKESGLHGAQEFEKDYDVRVLEGSAMGVDNSYLRLNLGSQDLDFKILIDLLKTQAKQ
jgi:L-tryptophan--pyruvate aminotransferase